MFSNVESLPVHMLYWNLNAHTSKQFMSFLGFHYNAWRHHTMTFQTDIDQHNPRYSSVVHVKTLLPWSVYSPNQYFHKHLKRKK